MHYFDLSFEDTKVLLKKLQEDKKQVLKGKQRNILVTPLVVLDKIVEFSLTQYDNFHVLAKIERERSRECFNDRKALEETGIFNTENFKKASKALETEEKIKKWTENAYPKITEAIWDIEFEEQKLIEYLKSFKI